MAANTRTTTRPAGPQQGERLVLRYSPVIVAALVAICLVVAVVIAAVPHVHPGDRLLFVGLGGLVAVAALTLGWVMAASVTVDDAGLERRRPGTAPVRLAWADVDRVTTRFGQTVRLLGRQDLPRIDVSSNLSGFDEFLDRLESRPEYAHWTRGASDPGEGIGATFRRPWPSFGLGLAAAVSLALALVFARDPAMFRGWRGDDPRAALFNLAFIDHPALGQGLLFALSFAATAAALTTWHTLRLEHDTIELESLVRTRSIPLDEVAAIDLKVDRGRPVERIRSFDHLLKLRLIDGRTVRLLRGEPAKLACDAIARVLAARRERAGGPSVVPGGPT